MKKLLFINITIFSLLIGCNNNIINPANSTSSLFETNMITGRVILPEQLNINYKDLTVFCTDYSTLNSNGDFFVESFKNLWNSIIVFDKHNNILALSFTNSENNIIIDEKSTALALILMLPIPWENYFNTKLENIIQYIYNNNRFSNIVTTVKSIFAEKPTKLIELYNDSDFKENIKELLTEIPINKITKKKNAIQNGENSAYIDLTQFKNSEPKITIKNPKNIPFGISGIDINLPLEDENTYYFNKKPIWIESKGIIGFLFGEVEREYNVANTRSIICLAKADFNWTTMVKSSFYSTDLPSKLSFAYIGNILEKEYNKLESQKYKNFIDAIRLDAQIKATNGLCFTVLFNLLGIIPVYGDVPRYQ